jgi:hypothetical protein
MTEPEWDSEDSGNYHDGYEHGQADARGGRTHDDRAGSVPPAWTDGYRDGWADTGLRRR